VGTSHETPAFAVEAIVLWWKRCGRRRYAHSQELLILADSGGSNSARARAWKYHLPQQLVNPFRLKVTVCHYPPGASNAECIVTQSCAAQQPSIPIVSLDDPLIS